jgi:hypothetical protein
LLPWKCKNTPALFVVGIDVAVNDIMVFNVATEMQQWGPFALLSSCKMFGRAVLTIMSFNYYECVSASLSQLSAMQITYFLHRVIL